MSVQYETSRNRWVVRPYEAGRRRTRRFAEEQTARSFDAERLHAEAAFDRSSPSHKKGASFGIVSDGRMISALDPTSFTQLPAMSSALFTELGSS